MKLKEILGYLIAVSGAGLIGPFALLSGLTQFDFINSYFLWIMGFGLVLSLYGLYLAGQSQDEESS